MSTATSIPEPSIGQGPSSHRGFHHTVPTLSLVTIAINECITISSAMRKLARWSQSTVAALVGGYNELMDDEYAITKFGAKPTHAAPTTNDDALLSAFMQLRLMLLSAKSLDEVDRLTLLQPFLLVIKSSSTSGAITALALGAVDKFLTYGLLALDTKNFRVAIAQVVSALTHCRFEAGDQAADDAVLLKVLRLLERLLVGGALSAGLTDEAVTEVIQTCLSLACNKRRSEVLRKAAEVTMVAILIRIFEQLETIEVPNAHAAEDTITDFTTTELPEDTIGGIEVNAARHSLDGVLPDADDQPFGLPCIKDFLGILISMIAPSNQFHHMESTRVFALSLLNTAVEVSSTHLALHPQLLNLVADPLCKHLLQIIQTPTETLALLRAALLVFNTLVITLSPHLRLQIELVLNTIFKSLVPEEIVNTTSLAAETPKAVEQPLVKLGRRSGTASPAPQSALTLRTPIAKEMLVESVSLLWSRSPTFFATLFINYDCDFDRTDLCTDILKYLAYLALPDTALYTTNNVPPICLEGLVSVVASIYDTVKNLTAVVPAANELVANKAQKKQFVQCTRAFNAKPKAGLALFAEKGFISSTSDWEGIAQLLFHRAGRLDKKVLGEFLTHRNNTDLFKRFMELFVFDDMRVDEALRILLKTFRLPGESQQIERAMEFFANRYIACQSWGVSPAAGSTLDEGVDTTTETVTPGATPEGAGAEGVELEELVALVEPVEPDFDAVFILSYSIIMLNTDLHNPQVKQRMQFTDYQKNLKGVYKGGNFPEWYLEKIYTSIRDREIVMPEEHKGSSSKWFDDEWNNMLASSVAEPVVTTSLDRAALAEIDRVIFQAAYADLVVAFTDIFEEAFDDQIVTQMMLSLDKCAFIASHYQIEECIDHVTLLFCRLTTLTGTQRTVVAGTETRTVLPLTRVVFEEKEQAPVLVSETSYLFGMDFKAQLSTIVLFRILKKSRSVVSRSWDDVLQIVLVLLENGLVDPNIFPDFQRTLLLQPLPTAKPHFTITRSKGAGKEAGSMFGSLSRFLKGNSDLPDPSEEELEATQYTRDCLHSCHIPSVFAHASLLARTELEAFIGHLLRAIPEHPPETQHAYGVKVLFLMEMCVCFVVLSFENECVGQDTIGAILDAIDVVLTQSAGPATLASVRSRLLTFKLLLLKTVTETAEASLVATTKELCALDTVSLLAVAPSLIGPLQALADSGTWCESIVLADSHFWKLLRSLASDPVHTSLVFGFVEGVVKATPHRITADNYVWLLSLLDEVSTVGCLGAQDEQIEPLRALAAKPLAGGPKVRALVDLSLRSVTLTAGLLSEISSPKFEQSKVWYTLAQAVAHQCFNPCREIRSHAIKTLQRLLLLMRITTEVSPEGLFQSCLLPLLYEVVRPEVLQTDPLGMSKTQTELLSVICKTFLHLLGKFDDVEKVWTQLREATRALNSQTTLPEATLLTIKEETAEIIKNLVLVMEAAGVNLTALEEDEVDKEDTETPPQTVGELETPLASESIAGHSGPVPAPSPEALEKDLPALSASDAVSSPP